MMDRSVTPPALDDFTVDEAFDDWEGWPIADVFGLTLPDWELPEG